MDVTVTTERPSQGPRRYLVRATFGEGVLPKPFDHTTYCDSAEEAFEILEAIQAGDVLLDELASPAVLRPKLRLVSSS